MNADIPWAVALTQYNYKLYGLLYWPVMVWMVEG